MIKITKLTIQRFRSIIDMSLDFNVDSNIVSICGPNNVGKTNVLRALCLFFNPQQYNPKTDIPTLKNATWGGAVHPKVIVYFFDDSTQQKYVLERDFKKIREDSIELSGCCIKNRVKTNLSKEAIDSFMNDIQFFNIESANLVIPDVIEKITEDMISLEYDKARFTSNKTALRTAYNTYIDGLQDILNIFADNISETFRRFRDSWGVAFNVPKNSDTFRDLISDDVSLTIKDKGSNGIVEKGSGLQRLALILLQFEIADKLIHKKNAIICIDEPDMFLHEGLQRKLKEFLDEKALSMQIFLTTHSKIFIDTFGMKNTILLDAKLYDQYVTRRNKNIEVMETIPIDIGTEKGYKIICSHLGIEEKKYEILEEFNLLVEGECDKKYISELSRYFKLKEPKFISANGADNMIKYLDFYESYYRNYTSFTPFIRVILDNDIKGRETLRKLKAKKFQHIKAEYQLLPNFLNDADYNLEKNNTNNEIEDFIYPEILCELINTILKKRGMNTINTKEVCSQIQTKSFKSAGILNLCEHIKNKNNPDRGDELNFISSHETTNQIKEGLAGLFNIEGNRKIIGLLTICHEKYPLVKESLNELVLPITDYCLNDQIPVNE